MSFNPQGMRVQVFGPPTMWSYRTEDTHVQVLIRGYFDRFTTKFGVGDWVFVTTSTGSLILHVDEIDPLELSSPR
jgi:hypothetical protein